MELAINRLLQQIETNIKNPKKVEQTLNKFQEQISQLSQEAQSPYYFFLAQISATMFKRYSQVTALLIQMKKQSDQKIQIGASLRLAFIYVIENKYKQALKQLHNANNLGNSSQELRAIMHEGLNRMKNNFKDKNVFQGLLALETGDQRHALSCFTTEYNSTNNQDKYFIAKLIKMKFQNKAPSKINSYIDEYIEQEVQANQLYEEKKRFLEFLMRTQKGSQTGHATPQMRTAARNKIATILRQDTIDSQVRQDLQKVYNDLLNKDIHISKQAILNFIVPSEESQIDNKMNKHRTTSEHIKPSNPFVSNNMSSEIMLPEETLNQTSPNPKHTGMTGMTGHRTYSKILNSDQDIIFHEVISEQTGDKLSNFEGSQLIKINATSSGHEKRYFYIKKSDISKNKLKLYYCDKKKHQSDSNQFYDVRDIVKITQGKESKAFNRSECNEFEKKQCFTIYTKNQQRNFYVPNPTDYQQWITLLNKYLAAKEQRKLLNKTAKAEQGSLQKRNSMMSKSSNQLGLTGSKLKKTAFM